MLKLARTIADLAGSESISPAHLAEAVQAAPGGVRTLPGDIAAETLDIFNAAREALVLAKAGGNASQDRIADIRKQHLRAYESWSPEEDASLRQLVQAGESTKAISSTFQRQPGAIQSRIRKLGLATDGCDHET